MTDGVDARAASQAVIAAARELVRSRRWFLELPPDRPLPDDVAAALERALAALDAEADHAPI
ncbi:hypothetical protein [Methylobacterium iners]|uniref:Uncharacterized protein n=1 Tax=Methylobacterium iners TaxID=418707 RepID=A0ABQ4S6Z8_9HYPH|nr:hypothetical protein [Methylobacterium iners]GJD97455.1 hypothetical protein OCOJLMKI_4686 [Methylobacterium iners]